MSRPVPTTARLLSLLAAAATLTPALPAAAYLGSFTGNDGYFLGSGTILGDVTYYNAGQYGPNAGGGPGPTQITADTGLWSLVSPVGGYFANTADRLAATSAGPPYPTNPTTAVPAYLVGDHFPGRNDFGSLALRNDTPLGTGAMVYDYQFDTYDFGGLAPASITAGPLVLCFYFCPNPGDTPNPGTRTGDKFTLSLTDSSGNVGMEFGYLRDNAVVWRDSNTNPWNPTAFIADQSNWDGVRITLDLTSDTFGFDYYDVSNNTWNTIVSPGTAMGMPMNNFTTLRWQLEDGLSAGIGGKNFFDDFKPLPEPASATALLALAAFTRRRR